MTGDGRPLPSALKAQISRELDRIELLIEQIKAVEKARDDMMVAAQTSSPAPALLLNLKGIGPQFAAVIWSEGLSRHFDNRRQVAAYAGLAPSLGRAERLIATKACRNRAIPDYERRSSNWPGSGYGTSPTLRSPPGSKNG